MTSARRLAVSAGLATLAWAAPMLGLDPAGPPEPPPAAATVNVSEADAPPEVAARETPQPGARGETASRSWLAQGRDGNPEAPTPEGSGASTGLTLGAVLILLGLAAAAVVLRLKRPARAPLSPSESRLAVLSSSRVGPKAYAVTAHVGGRALLLGVTDHNVTLLGWLDAPEPVASAVAAQDDAGGPEPENDELPDDYPGSALRTSASPVQFATSGELRRFQEVLRGAVRSRPDPPLRPSYTSRAPDAATTLAAQTMDVLASGATPPRVASATATPAPLSLRRKRRGRESSSPREPRPANSARGPDTSSSSLEGQVAGLRSLRSDS